MKKRFLILVSLLLSLSVFGEEWYVCIGSFKDAANANARYEILKENFFPAEIQETKNDAGETLYKVLLSEVFDNKLDAIIRREEIKRLAVIQELKINDLWCWEKPAPVIAQPEPAPVAQVAAIFAREPEVYESRYIYIKDSDSGLPVDNANVNIDERWNRWTDYEGKASLPEEIEDGEHSLVVTRGDEYVPTEGTFSVSSGEVTTINQISIPRAVDYERVKIVLTWGEYPEDLDSHVFAGSYHVYFSNMNGGGINLDRDDVTSYGPETTTIREPRMDTKYEYYVHNFSNRFDYSSEYLSHSEAVVKVYINNEYKKTYTIKPNQKGIAWHVFDIVNGSEIVDVDTVIQEDHHF